MTPGARFAAAIEVLDTLARERAAGCNARVIRDAVGRYTSVR